MTSVADELKELRAMIVSEHEQIAVLVDSAADAIAAGLPPYQVVLALRQLSSAIREMKN